MKSKRVIIDTNLWISFLISKKHLELDKLITSKKIKLLFSSELIEEFLEVANRKKFRKYFKKQDVQNLIELLNVIGVLIEVKSKVSLCRDYKDNFLLNLAIDSNAEYLITGDSDLLILGEIENTKIVTLTEFLKINS
jgi:putative PIN family toxin of toxin-antitoxin system